MKAVTANLLVKETWKRIDKVIIDHGGTITNHIGDEVTAVWGLPNPSGMDAERAVNCALALQSLLTGFAVEGRKSVMGNLKLKIGLSSGEALITRMGMKNDLNLIGETVNTAKRLSELASPEKILIGPVTFHMVHGVFRIYRISDLFLRGKTEAMNGYYVEGRHDQPTRIRYTGTGGLETRMVGREAEFKALLDLFEPLDLATDPFLVLIVGGVGHGKSRLMLEFSSEIESARKDFNFMSVRGTAEAYRTPFYIWKTLFKQRCGIRDDMPLQEAQENLLRGVINMWGKELGKYTAVEAAHFIGELIGLKWKGSPYIEPFHRNPEARNQRAFELIRELFTRVGTTGPVFLLIDDVQWVDAGSLELLLHILEQGTDPLPMVVIASMQPDYLEAYPEWERLSYEVVRLGPIQYTFEMIEQAFPSLFRLPEGLLARMIERSGGVPLYLEEIVKHIHFDRLMRSEEPRKAPSVAYPIPNTLKGLLLTRMDQVSLQAREVMQLASVAGRVFWRGSIIAAAKQPVGTGILNLPIEVLEKVVDNALNEISRAELAFRRTSPVYDGEQEYIFKHQLLQETAYEILPEKYRKFYHFAVAKWLADKVGPDMQVNIARHYERGGNISSALRYYQSALEYAEASGVFAEVELLQQQINNIRSGEKHTLPRSTD